MIFPAELRKDFALFLFVENIDQASDLRGYLAVGGYQVFLFRDQETLLDRVREAAPHLVIFEISALQTDLSEFVERCLAANVETQLLPIAGLDQAKLLFEYREFNFAGIFPIGPDRDLRLIWEVDRICSGLYLQYQNEQLSAQIPQLQAGLEKNETQLSQLSDENKKLSLRSKFNLTEEAGKFLKVSSKEEMIETLFRTWAEHLQQLGMKPFGVYFKFLNHLQSFVALSSIGVNIESLKNVGAQLEPEEVGQVEALLKRKQWPKNLTPVIEKGLQVEKFSAKALYFRGQVEGIFIFWGLPGPVDLALFDPQFEIFQLMFENYSLEKRLREIDFRDPLTDLESRDFYLTKLDEEIARSRRLMKAVSVVKISLDSALEIEQSYGTPLYHSVLQTMGRLIRKTSRINDFSCRTDENEFSLILPHCARKGAAIRAERIRRMVENHSFQNLGVRITVSVGVSEYPSLCSTSEDLEKSSSQALNYISEKGGNKVCLYRAPSTFKPDFDVSPL